MKVEKKVARIAFPPDIEPGDTYYRWKFRGSDWQRSKTYPDRKQLTRSPFLIEAYELDDRFQALSSDPSEPDEIDDIISEVSEIADAVRSLGEGAQESLENMPESLQASSPVADLLQERMDGCETWAEELDQAASELENFRDEWTQLLDDKDTTQEMLDDHLAQLDNILTAVTCPF